MLAPSVLLIRQPDGAAALGPAGDDAPTGFLLGANHCRNREFFIRWRLVQRDTVQPFLPDRLTVEEAPHSVRKTNATGIPPIRPFEAVSNIAQHRIVVGIGHTRGRMIASKIERCPPAGIMVSETDRISFQHGISIGARQTQRFRNKRCKIAARRGIEAWVKPRDSDCAEAQVSHHARVRAGALDVGDAMRPRIDHLGVHFDTARAPGPGEIRCHTESGNIEGPADVVRLPRFPILPIGFQVYVPDGLKSGPAANRGSGFIENRKHRVTSGHCRLPTQPALWRWARDRAAASWQASLSWLRLRGFCRHEWCRCES